MRSSLLILVASAAVLLVRSNRPARVVATASGFYLEDAVIPRPVATVSARVIANGGGYRLELGVSAIGVGIDPLPGIEGIPGSNLRTAEELGRLLREQDLRMVTRIDGVNHAGELLAVTMGRVPQRRWRDDGGIEPSPPLGPELPIGVGLVSVSLPSGTSQSYLEAGGVPRLLVEVTCAAGRAPQVRCESLAEAMFEARSAGSEEHRR